VTEQPKAAVVAVSNGAVAAVDHSYLWPGKEFLGIAAQYFEGAWAQVVAVETWIVVVMIYHVQVADAAAFESVVEQTAVAAAWAVEE